MSELCTWSADEVAGAIRRGEASCREVTEELLTQARRIGPALACFINLEADAARERARQLDAGTALQRGRRPDAHPVDDRPLFGVPFAHKDVFVTEGRLPTAGAQAVKLAWAGRRSAVLERLDQAGTVALGPLNLDQFGYAATGLNPDFGDVLNPWDTERIAGGSSSGAAAAVAARAVPFAVGSDTGGSVRIPASLCGVVGLKPTFGRISRHGALALSYSQDTIGLLTRSVPDAALVLDALAGHDPLDAGSFDVPAPGFHARLTASKSASASGARLEGVRMGVDAGYLRTAVSDEVRRAVERATEIFTDLGARIVEVDLSSLARGDVAATVLTWAEATAVHGPSFARDREHYAPTTRGRLDAALATNGADHVDALRYQGRALREFSRQVLAKADVVVTASTARTAATLQAARAGEQQGAPVSLEGLRLNRPFNYLGLPAMSLPMGFGLDGLPLGLQLVARPWAELLLLICGSAYQEVTDWHRRLPPIVLPWMRSCPVPSSSG